MNDGRSWFTEARLSRRRLLRAATGSIALVTGSVLAGAVSRRDATVAAPDRLAALLPGASAAAVGRAYLATGPDVADLHAVLAALREKIPALAGPDQASDGRLRELLDARTRADFGASDTLRVDGWILARTETLLCAYVALVGDRAA